MIVLDHLWVYIRLPSCCFFFYWDSRFITVINGIFPHCCCAEDELVGHVLDDCSGYLADMLLSLARKGG